MPPRGDITTLETAEILRRWRREPASPDHRVGYARAPVRKGSSIVTTSVPDVSRNEGHLDDLHHAQVRADAAKGSPSTMNFTIDILRGELERLFSLEEMTSMSELLLDLDPADVGGTSAKGSFARALAERCVDGDRLEALVDVILMHRRDVDPRVRDLSALLGSEEIPAGRTVGPFTIERKIGESDHAIVYAAQRDGGACTVKLLKREASRDRRAVQRFLTANRLVSQVAHDGLPRKLEAGEVDSGLPYVSYDYFAGQTLAQHAARSGAVHIDDLKPLLRGILEPLAALHKAQLAHGDLKLENVLVSGAGEDARVVLIDFGADRLRPRTGASNGHTGLLAVVGSPRTLAPELARGRAADARSDVYAFGAMLYELLTGQPVFVYENATDAVVAHLTFEPEAPSSTAPRGWIAADVDAFVLSLLDKEASARPKDASALLEVIDGLGRASTAMRASAVIPEEAIALEATIDDGADPQKVAEAFEMAAASVDLEAAPPETKDDALETVKGLLHRAARIFDTSLKDMARCEGIYERLVGLDPKDDVAASSLERARRQLGKFDEIVEMLLVRSEEAGPGEQRARALAEIGRLCAEELDDEEQALVAYSRALCETPLEDQYAREVERLGGTSPERWAEALEALAEGTKQEALSSTERNALLGWAGRWYDTKLGRADTALLAYQQILTTDPGNDAASEGLTGIYRRAQQWPELAALLLSRADAATGAPRPGTSAPRGRDLRAEAAEILETKLNDTNRARDLYAAVLAEDPGHGRAGDALAKIAERSGDFETLVKLLERRAESRRGAEKAEALAKVGEVYEDHLDDLVEATRRFEAVLAIDPAHLGALKGLDRIYNRGGRYKELLENLERQVELAATPRQKINLYERIAALHDEEFIDHESAARALEAILEIDGANDFALTTLARHYRALDLWEEVARLYEKHAGVTGDEARRVELLAARARVLAEQIGSPERAMRAFDQVIELAPGHAGALEALARLRELSGDAHAALSAIEALAAKAQTPEAKAEQWTRAARLLEGRGDKDGAIERYKLALDANPKDIGAATALRHAYAQRGDVLSVVQLIERELATVEGDLGKARLHSELARVFREKVKDDAKAEASAKRAVALDPTSAEALMVLGDLSFDAERYIEASRAYESIIGRTTVLPAADAVRVLVNFIEAFGKSYASRVSSPSVQDVTAPASVRPVAANHPQMIAAVEALQKVAPDDVEALSRAARVIFEHGDPKGAFKVYEDLLAKHDRQLTGTDRADVLYRLGESARRSEDVDAAIPALHEAADLDPSNALPLQSLAWIYDARGDYEDVVKTKKKRLEVATGTERFELLLEIGDIEFQKLNDRTRASKTYVAALEERPDDRKLLTKLMQLYSEEKDWAKLVEVVLRLADFVEDPKQRAKYMHTAAIVSHRQLGETDAALGFYDRALEFDPTLAKALDEAIELRRTKGDHEGVEKLLNVQLEQAKTAGDRTRMVKVLDQLGALYQKSLNEPEMAIDAYEAAQAFDPEDRPRAELLAELYASDVTQYLDKAFKAQAQILRRNPYRVESYKLLRRLFTEAKRADAAWCLCQALSVMNLAEPDEERFYKRHRADSAAAAQAVLGEDDWASLAHADVDPLLTRIFAMIQPTIIRARTQTLEQMGYDPRYAIDPSQNPSPVSQTLFYAQGVLGLPPPLVFQNPNDAAGLGFLHAHTPAIVLGRAAFENTVPTQAMAFVAGRHLTYFRPGYYVRHLVPTGTGLKAWLFAAIKMSVPQFPVPGELQGQVAEAMRSMQADFQGMQKEKLASLVSKLLQAGGALDLKKWVAAIDFTADRAGFLLAYDLGISTEVMRATEDAASVAAKERMKEIVLFSVSEEYFALREKLGIRIDS
jgi:tetratricopeptide (TPR) repeat protein